VSAFDHNRIGQLRIEKDRALARIEALIAAGDLLAADATKNRRHAWEQAKQFDGAPPRRRGLSPEDLGERPYT